MSRARFEQEVRQRILSGLPAEIQRVGKPRAQIRFDAQGLVERRPRIPRDFAREVRNALVELVRKLQISRGNVSGIVSSGGPELPSVAGRQARITRVTNCGEVREGDFQRLGLVGKKVIALHRSKRICRSAAEVSLYG